MTEPITAAKLTEIEAYCEAATPGPWHWEQEWRADEPDRVYDGSMGCLEPGIAWYGMDGAEGIYCPKEADAFFLSAARTDLPVLTATIRELWKALEAAPPIHFLHDDPDSIMPGFTARYGEWCRRAACILEAKG